MSIGTIAIGPRTTHRKRAGASRRMPSFHGRFDASSAWTPECVYSRQATYGLCRTDATRIGSPQSWHTARPPVIEGEANGGKCSQARRSCRRSCARSQRVRSEHILRSGNDQFWRTVAPVKPAEADGTAPVRRLLQRTHQGGRVGQGCSLLPERSRTTAARRNWRTVAPEDHAQNCTRRRYRQRSSNAVVTVWKRD
jgi:hypothetical protein